MVGNTRPRCSGRCNIWKWMIALPNISRPQSCNVAAIHDLSGFGRCSLTAAIPILSAMGIHCCPLPTAILSNQTGFADFSYLDFTPYMPDFIVHWHRLGLAFRAIYTGFLGSEDQVDVVADFIRAFRTPETIVAVDPVMGDNGRRYPTFSDRMCGRMKELVRQADIVFPNLTETVLLTGCRTPIDRLTEADIAALAEEIAALGPRQVVVTGVAQPDAVTNYLFDYHTGERMAIGSGYNHKSYSGTGDIFASVVCGGLTRGESLPDAVRRAVDFIKRAVDYTEACEGDTRAGVLFEPFLKELG